MDKKRILIVSASFFPESSPRANRATELAREFSRQGHDVVVLTEFKDADYNKIAADFNITLKNIGKRRWKSPDFGKSKLGYFLSRAIYRLGSLSIEYPQVELVFKIKKTLKKEKDYDLLISSAVPYPVHWGVAASRKQSHKIAKAWIADCGDPYMGCETDSFKKLFYFKYIEKWFMRKADYISIPVESARSGYYDEFQDKIKVIPQGFKFDFIEGSEKPVKNQVLTFAYAGAFIPNIRDPRPFLDYLSKLDHDFKFIIYTNTAELIASYVLKLNERLEIRDYIPRQDLLKVLSRMDFLVNFDNNTGVQVPSKLIDYALVGKPILNIKATIDPVLINAFFKGDYSGNFNVKDIQKYKIENVVKQFLNLL
jgi:hypothetical protein